MTAHSITDSTDRRLADLVVLIDRITALHRDLHCTLSEKLECMQLAEVDRIHGCVQEQRELVARINEQDGLRKQLAEQIGRAYGMSADTARSLSLTKLADRVGSPRAVELHGAADRLRAAVGDVRKMNDMVERVSCDVLRHMREVFAAAADGEPAGCYSPAGKTVAGRARELFEAVG